MRIRGVTVPAAVFTTVGAQALITLALTDTAHPLRPVLLGQSCAFALSLVALLMLRRLRWTPRRTALLLVTGCALLQLAALAGPPASSDDDYRYAWDGRVQLAGVDPYRYPPADAALVPLREPFTFTGQQPCPHYPVPGGCTRINRPLVRTIYPPAAEAVFAGLRVLTGGRGGHLPFQLAAALGVLATTVLLVRAALRRGRPLWPVALWAWSPVVAFEATNNAHLDWLVALLSVAGLLSLTAARPVRAGLWIGAAIATKLYPGLLLVTAGRRPGRVIAAAVALVAVSYLPHLLAVGPDVIGYLPGYLSEESYRSGHRYALLEILVGTTGASWLAPAVLVAAGTLLWWRCDPRRPERTAVVAAGVFLLVSTPEFPWYALLLTALIALAERPEWLWVAFAPALRYFARDLHWNLTAAVLAGYGLGALLVLAVSLHRHHGSSSPNRKVLPGPHRRDRVVR